MDGSSATSEMFQPRDIVLYKSPKVEISVPKKPKIPVKEGLHVQVKGEHDSSDTAKEALLRLGVALGVSNIIVGGSQTPKGPWANTRFEKGQAVSVYERIIDDENSWRKPVDTLDRNSPQIDILPELYDQPMLQKLFRRYMPKWEEMVKQLKLFQNGAAGVDHDPSAANLQGGFTLWENDSVKVTIIRNPHLAGLHLMVDAKTPIDRQWQTIPSRVEMERQVGLEQDPEKQNAIRNEWERKRIAVASGEEEPELIRNTIEAAAVALGVQKLLGGGGEIHNSGNWAGDLKTTDEGGKLLKDAFLRDEKLSKEEMEKLLGTAETREAIAQVMREKGRSDDEIAQRIAGIGRMTENELRDALLRRTAVAEKRAHTPSRADDANRIGTFMHFHVYLPEKSGAPVVLPALSRDEALERLSKETDQARKAEYQQIISAWDAIPPTTNAEMVRVRESIGNGKLNTWLLQNASGSLT